MKTMVGAVAHDVTEGKVLINGVAYSIKQGKTLVNGVAYDIGGNAAPGMKELWADAQLLGKGGNNTRTMSKGKITSITASDSQVYILFFTGTGMAVYTVSGINSSENFTPTGDITLISFRNLPTITDLIEIYGRGIQSTQKYYGVTMAAISFPSYTVDQVTAIFESLTYVGGSGLNSSTQLNLAIPVADERASDVMFLAVGPTLKIYLPPLDSATSPAPYAWSSGASWGLGHPTGVTTNSWYAVGSTGGLVSLYGASLIAFKEG